MSEQPTVFRHPTSRGQATSFPGFVIAERHINVHTFPSCRIAADIFEVEDASSMLRDAFHAQRVEWHLLDRGRELPRDLAGSRALVVQHRRLVAAGLGLEALR